MNWKKIALWAVVVIVVLKFSAQIKAAVSGVPGVGKLIG